MGIGDCLMASGEARALWNKHKTPVLIIGRHQIRYWSEMWDNVPYIIRRPAGRKYQTLVNGSGLRPYIDLKTGERWYWKPFVPTPAQITFTPVEKSFAEPYRGMVMVEPNTKDIGHSNKVWSYSRWQQVVSSMPEVRFVQCGPGTHAKLMDVREHVVTSNFRLAAAVLSVCRAYIGTEGGLHHAAAAAGVPAVVVFGGFISPDVTGYKQHRNLFTGEGLGCGMRKNCAHCRAAMEAITTEDVIHNLKEILSANA